MAKSINDPIYGSINITTDITLKLIEHPWFLRLSRIKQMSVAYLVYPSATHTRLSHSLGAYYLMDNVLNELIHKGIKISVEEKEAAKIAILLHDIGHAPFSHTLEHIFLNDFSHEDLSTYVLNFFKTHFNHDLITLAYAIFTNQYDKKFLYQLISSQLDLDRMDYLNRDSFFTGVAEGNIAYHRLINVINVCNNELVIEEKGIYSVEQFFIARQLMYMQVYHHKTVWSIEQLLILIIQRIKELLLSKYINLYLDDTLKKCFLADNYNMHQLYEYVLRLDDHDIMCMIKQASQADDVVLRDLCEAFLNRRLYKIKALLTNDKTYPAEWQALVQQGQHQYIGGSVKMYNYNFDVDKSVKILCKNGDVKNFNDMNLIFLDGQQKYYYKHFLGIKEK